MIKGNYGIGKGKLTANVSIIDDPENQIFNHGDILVCKRTTFAYIPLIKKASAVITDFGSRTSHAMIVCRDNKVNCVIGTYTATKDLKDGDEVEIDFDKLTVRKI